jgi:glycosyltransferase 2 family protein
LHLIKALRALGKMPRWYLVGLYLITVGFWLPRYLVMIIVIHLVGHSNAPFTYLLLVQGVLNLGGQVFLLPGGAGTVDAGYAAFLSPYLARDPLALTLLVWRTYTFYWFLVVGGPIFLLKTGKAAHDLLTKKT